MSPAQPLYSEHRSHHPGALVWVSVPVQASPSRTNNDIQAKRWVPATVSSVDIDPTHGGVVLSLNTPHGPLSASAHACPLRNERDDTIDDLVKSDFLHEPGILHTLQARYALDAIYTFSGPNILIAVNPHKPLPPLYGLDMMRAYHNTPLGELSPHVYAIAEQAFSSMRACQGDAAAADGGGNGGGATKQAILISGESGAGKTETAKAVMQYLTNRCGLGRTGSVCMSDIAAGHVAPIEQQVLESNPLLEAFGNAKTMRNNNSSRFGKWVEMFFDTRGKVVGACINTYLLERSRVVSVNDPERSFHIFYRLCAHEPSAQQYHLHGGPAAFSYLSRSTCHHLDTINDADAFRATIDAMSTVGITPTEQHHVLSIVAAVLHLGNVEFAPTSGQDGGAGCVLAGPAAQEACDRAAALLQVDAGALVGALTTRTIASVEESIVITLEPHAAAEARDALAKVLYARLFDWIVAATNRKITTIGSATTTPNSIGILDIYGFESFVENSFEQLCINLANEKLQQQFNATIFKAEQQEYVQEGIDWTHVEFVDNQDCLDLLEGGVGGKSSLGVFPLIDEACRMPKATYEDLAHTIRTQLLPLPRFNAPPRPQHAFTIDHYAGPVAYSTQYIIDKNKDFEVAEQLALLASSNNSIVAACFQPTTPTTTDRPAVNNKKNSFRFNSLGASFRKQLQGLMTTLNQCQPLYIRCVKPNASSVPSRFDSGYALEQLRAGGVLEAVRIACAGFPTRKEFHAFVQRYALLLSDKHHTPRNWHHAPLDHCVRAATTILSTANLHGSQVGKTRVFLKAGHLAALESARTMRITKAVVSIQSAWRGVSARQYAATRVVAVVRVQTVVRGWLARCELQRLRRERAALRVQCAWRMWSCRRVLLHHRRTRAAVIMQTRARGALHRRRFLSISHAAQRTQILTAAAVVVQSHWRRVCAARRVAVLLTEARKWKVLEAQRDEYAAQRDKHAAHVNVLQEELRVLKEQMAVMHKELVVVKQDAAQVGLLKQQVVELKHQAEEGVKIKDQVATLTTTNQQLHTETATLKQQLDAALAQHKAYKQDAQHLRKAAEDAEAVAKQLRKEIQAAQEVGHCKHATKEATIATLRAQLAASQTDMQRHIADARKHARAEVGQRMGVLEGGLRTTRAELGRAKEGYGRAMQRNVQLIVRLVVANMQRGVAVRRLQGGGSGGALLGGTMMIATPPAYSGGVAGGVHVMDGPSAQHAQQLMDAVITHAMLPTIPLPLTEGAPCQAPVAGWVMGTIITHWFSTCISTDSNTTRLALTTVLDGCVKAAQGGDLATRAYWVHVGVMAGAVVRAASVGHAQSARLFRPADELMHCAALQALLGEAWSQQVAVDVHVLTDDDKRTRAAHATDANDPVWKDTFDALSAALHTLSSSGIHPLLIKAIIKAQLLTMDAHLLNALVLRREACDIAGAEALRGLLEALRGWAAQEGALWRGDVGDVDRCMERCQQAVVFLLRGKDVLAAHAQEGMTETFLDTLSSQYGALSALQLVRLAEQHHDAWTSGGVQDTTALLQLLGSVATQRRQQGGGEAGGHTPLRRRIFGTPGGVAGRASLLVDTTGPFTLSRKLVAEAARELCSHETLGAVGHACRAVLQQDVLQVLAAQGL